MASKKRRFMNNTDLDIASMLADSGLDDSDVIEISPTEPNTQPVDRVNVTCKCGHRTTVPRVLAVEGANCPRCRQPLKLPEHASAQPVQPTTVQSMPLPAQPADKFTVNCTCGHRFTAPRALSTEGMACPRCRKPVALPNQVATNAQQQVAPPSISQQSPQETDVHNPVSVVQQPVMTPPVQQSAMYSSQPTAHSGYKPTPGLPLTGSSAQFVVPHANSTVTQQHLPEHPVTQQQQQSSERSPTEAQSEQPALSKPDRKPPVKSSNEDVSATGSASQGDSEQTVQEPLKLEHRLSKEPRLSKDEYTKRLKKEMAKALKTKSSLKVESQNKPILSKGKLKKLTDAITKRPTDPSEASVQAGALSELAKSRDYQGLDLILPQVTSPWDVVREALASSLGYVAHPDAADGLIKLLDDSSNSIRRAAIDSLVKLKDPRCVRPLMTLSFEEPCLRFQVPKALLEMGDCTVEELIKITGEKDSEMTVQAVMILASIGKDKAVRRLVNLLGHPEAIVRAETAAGLAKVRDPRTAGPLARCLDDPEQIVRIEVTAALVKLPNAKNVNVLLNTLVDDDPVVRANSAAALGSTKHNQCVPALIQQLEDDVPEVRYAVIEALGLIGDKRSAPNLIELLDSEDVNAKTRAIIALRNHGDERATPYLENLLGDRESIVRRRAVEALGKCGNAKVADKLGKVLTLDRLSELRAAAARSLGEIGDRTSVPFLEEALRDEVAVRCHAVSSLGAIADESCSPALLAMLKDSAPEVRYQAASALSKLNDPNSIEPLCNALDEEKDEMVIRGLKKTLDDMGAIEAYENYSKSSKKKSSTANISQDMLRMGAGVTGVVAVVVLCVIFLLPGSKSNAANGNVKRGGVSGITFSPDGSKLGVGHSFGTFELWQLGKNELIAQLPGTCGSRPLFSSNGKKVYYRKGTVLAGLNLDSAEVEWDEPDRKGHSKAIVSELMSYGRDVVVTVSLNRNIISWNTDSGTPIGKSDVRLIGGMTTVQISPDGKALLFGTDKGHIEEHSVADGSLTTKLEGFRGNIQALAYSPDGNLVAAGNQAGGVAVWKIGEPAKPFVLDTQAAKVRRVSVVAFHPIERILAVAEHTGKVHHWNLQSGVHKQVNDFESDRITHLTFSPDGNKIAFGGDEAEEVFLYDFRSNKVEELNVEP